MSAEAKAWGFPGLSIPLKPVALAVESQLLWDWLPGSRFVSALSPDPFRHSVQNHAPVDRLANSLPSLFPSFPAPLAVPSQQSDDEVRRCAPLP